MSLTTKRLLLFLTLGMSLSKWDRVGMLERELELYRRLRPELGGVTLLSYGGSEESRYAGQLDGLELRHNRWNLPKRVFSRSVPLLFPSTMARCALFKTNQTNGSEVALAAKRIFGKKLIARCGYMWSLNEMDSSGGEETDAVRRARRIEKRVFRAADRVVVTTPMMKRYALTQYGLDDAKVAVIPNYVLTDVFKPRPRSQGSRPTLCFVGRLEEMKSPHLLLEAAKGLAVDLVMIGSGRLRAALEARAEELGLSAHFPGNVPHRDLPRYLNSSTIFVQPSRYENHPKTLLEAMACGLPVVGTDVRGIREVIQHDVNGYLCDQTVEGLHAAIATLLHNPSLRDRLGDNARTFAVENLDIDRVVKLELELIGSLLSPA